MNQFHTHSQKKQIPTKKFIKSGQIEIARRRRRWDRMMEARSSGTVLQSKIGTVRSSDWSSVCGRRRSLFFLSLCDLSLSLSPEILWSKNENWIHFPPQKPYFTVKLKIFLVWPNLPDLPNILFSGKGFLNSIWSQNKWTLSPYPITSHVNIISIYKKCL